MNTLNYYHNPHISRRNKPSTIPQKASVAQITRLEYQGVLPPASQFKEYDDALPGAAERILRMAERQQEYRMHLEEQEQQQAYKLANRDLSAGVALTGLGQVLGLVFLSLVAGAGIWLVLNDKSIEGLISLVASIATLLTAFLKTRKSASEAT